ncbi:hypothetical protein [Vibrio chemaguriensis]|uniref:hypothetical protein n=1 Tax=Vibrio chemaguriensis TaxID=2527672 RepID=UPI001CDC3417|nr:hypothetical protein [Vibrio chemaguriensis]MCA2414047.1 hypothetical protein [Vibrio chemaguriensis]MCA2427966.1 hypothetical protein [Vibrio chemaguriensis]
MNKVVSSINNSIDIIKNELDKENIYGVVLEVCNDFMVPCEKLSISSDNSPYPIAEINPIIYMMPKDNIYAHIECQFSPANVFRDRPKMELIRRKSDEFEPIEINDFIRIVVSGLKNQMIIGKSFIVKKFIVKCTKI